TKECAERLRFEIQYSAQLRWITYRKILDMAELLLDRLRTLGARDFIDVQSFMWIIARYCLIPENAAGKQDASNRAPSSGVRWCWRFDSEKHPKTTSLLRQRAHSERMRSLKS